MFQCAEGYYSLGTGNTACIICPSNNECPDRDQSPVACGDGEVSIKYNIITVIIQPTRVVFVCHVLNIV